MFKNISTSILVQIVSLISAFFLHIIIPKFIDEYQYALWQMYLLYTSYVGIFHFGLLDGIVLRYSQFDYESLDKNRLGSQFIVLLSINTVICIILIIISLKFSNSFKIALGIFISLSIVITNVYTYTSYIFQITNRINRYAQLVIIQKIVNGLLVILILLFCRNKFFFICISELFSLLVSIIYCARYNKGLYYSNNIIIKDIIIEYKLNISAGIFLLFANWSSMLLIGGAKMVIQWHWGEIVFGKIAFSISVTNLFLTFINAISIVLFPTLKRIEEKRLPSIYIKIRNLISPILFFFLLLYFPVYSILKIWLPLYKDSLIYLGILMPIIIYTAKVYLLTNNYFKAFRKEKVMLYINLISVFTSFAFSFLFAYIFNNLYLVLYSLVFIIIIRSVISEIVISNIIKINIKQDIIIDLLITICFILFTQIFPIWIGFIFYLVVFSFYLLINKRKIIKLYREIKKYN
jgi:O-antigen/teichoic acid export membrane protein